MQYRADIQIMRGLSVMLVVIYHMKMNAFHSGFFGVDIFFVISGFLMAVLYQPSSGAAYDKHAVVPFLLRRGRRILPTYYVSLVLVIIAGYFLLLPSEFPSLVKHGQYSALLLANLGYWLENSYFDGHSFRPLLHFWSLAVEAQFYLIVPAVYWLFKKSPRSLLVIAVLSFVFCYLIAGRSPNTAFFQLPSRFWQFMLGFFAAAYLTEKGNVIQRRGNVGLLAIIALTVLSSINFGLFFRHPGGIALAVCLLAACVLVCGIPDWLEKSPLGRIFERLGEYSYSIYIVHFPIILFFYYRPFSGSHYHTDSVSDFFILSLLILVATLLLYHIVEAPLRKSRNTKLQITALLMCIFVTLVSLPLLQQSQRAQYDASQLSIMDAANDQNQFRCGELYSLLAPFSFSCALTDDQQNAAHGYLLVGNSHADSIKTSLAKKAQENNTAIRIAKSNFPLGMSDTSTENIIKEIKKHQLDGVILHSSPNFLVVDELLKLVSAAEQHRFKVIYLDSVPTWEDSVPWFLWDSKTNGTQLPKKNIGYHFVQTATERSLLSFVKSKSFKRYYPALELCKPYCRLDNDNGFPIYYDSHHLNLTGAQLLEPLFEQIFHDQQS